MPSPAPPSPPAPTLLGRDAYIARLRAGETVAFRESGNSMTPRIHHRQKCTYAPVSKPGDVQPGDAVFCRVKGRYFTHLIAAIRAGKTPDDRQYQITNNHGHVNGWVNLDSIFGKVIRVED